jgi:hypothetical protein
MRIEELEALQNAAIAAGADEAAARFYLMDVIGHGTTEQQAAAAEMYRIKKHVRILTHESFVKASDEWRKRGRE